MGFDLSNPYGPIEVWDVSLVKSFDQGFFGMTSFNEDISAWDVSSSISFQVILLYFVLQWLNQCYLLDFSNVCQTFCLQEMFSGAGKFNQDLAEWNVRRGRKFASM